MGCNIDLHRIASEARIFLVQTVVASPEEVREKFKRIKPLKDIPVIQRGKSKTPEAPARDLSELP